MSDQPIKFATEADRRAWEIDFMAFGSAITDQDGKHVPLKGLVLEHKRLTAPLRFSSSTQAQPRIVANHGGWIDCFADDAEDQRD